MINILAIDPSIRHIGFAILQIENKKITNVYDGTYNADPTDTPLVICRDVFCNIADHCGNLDISNLVIEFPQFMMGPKGLIAAQRGYTLDLALICGYLVAECKCGPHDSFLYTPSEWKGQRPKTATQAAFDRMFPLLVPDSEHSCDAVMLGVYHCKTRNLIN